MLKIITELSREMIEWKTKWLDLTRTDEQYKREGTVEELKGDHQRTMTVFYLEVPLNGGKIQCNMILH